VVELQAGQGMNLRPHLLHRPVRQFLAQHCSFVPVALQYVLLSGRAPARHLSSNPKITKPKPKSTKKPHSWKKPKKTGKHVVRLIKKERRYK
jgi:hypothetical protein